jgi:RNase P subunit RPR2
MEKKNINSNNSLLNDDKLKFYIDAIARFCDRCGSPYTTSDVKIVQDSGMSAIIHFSCSNCKSRHLATFLKPVGVSSRTPINTDLNINEINKFSNRKEISSDDVLEVYAQLKKGIKKL